VLLYSRELPSGGFVMIEADNAEGGLHHAFVAVERRADPSRRAGHEPPVIAEAHGTSRTTVFKELYGIACDNVAIARALIKRQARGR
jgi:hypothetical protein